jgi:hypothetical protein
VRLTDGHARGGKKAFESVERARHRLAEAVTRGRGVNMERHVRDLCRELGSGPRTQRARAYGGGNERDLALPVNELVGFDALVRDEHNGVSTSSAA